MKNISKGRIMYKLIEIMNILLEQDFNNKKHFTDELNRLCSLVDCEDDF